eukprot:TRINITY_DN8221_c0_g1_i9.p1 TRINITY_DN8221_c0_g1~~TRINITY_DN8221_c0_g1_i9.p1  ORF type:complete len:118 (-),score=6.71 TRINITY_DN8221_c0_g1_i9:337-690(-)
MSIRIPSYRLRKPSGRAVVTISGRDHYLGPFGSVQSRQLYGKLIAKHAAGLPTETQNPLAAESGLSVHELILAFMRHAKSHYQKDGVLTDEYACIKSATTPIVQLVETCTRTVYIQP